MIKNKLSRFNITYKILFGILCGLILFTGETVINLYHGNLISSIYYIIALFLYTLIGLLAGLLSIILIKIIHPINNKFFNILEKNQIELIFIPVFIIFVQGFILINEIILAGSSFNSIPSIIFDLLWLILCFVLLLSILRLSNFNFKYFKINLILGLIFSILCIATIYKYLEKPIEINYIIILLQIFLLFLSCLCIFFIVFLLSKTFSENLKRFRLIILFFGITIFCVFSILYFINNYAHKSFLKTSSLLNNINNLKKPNIILIVIDTLRADHLSCYGYNLKTSPNIDEFSLEAIKFNNCYSPANWTPPGHASIFTGKFPISHGAHKKLINTHDAHKHVNCLPLTQDELTLAEILKKNDYQTGAIIANHGFVSRLLGFDQGFEYWFNKLPRNSEPILYIFLRKLGEFKKFKKINNYIIPSYTPYRRAEDINKTALNWIKKDVKRPFHLFINYMEPHAPLLPPSPYDKLFDGKINNYFIDIDAFRNGQKTFTKTELKHIQSQYDGEIAYIDKQLGILFDNLKSCNLYDQSIIILTSDHGEFLGEHGLIDHQIGLYDPVIKVPLIIKPHKDFIWEGNTDSPVQTIDILPTALSMLDIQIPNCVQGNSLFSGISHPIIAEHYSDAHIQKWFGGCFSNNQKGIIEDNFKFILSRPNENELYDITNDKLENNNLIVDNQEKAKLLQDKLKNWENSVQIKQLSDNMLPELNENMKQKLKSLGYINY